MWLFVCCMTRQKKTVVSCKQTRVLEREALLLVVVKWTGFGFVYVHKTMTFPYAIGEMRNAHMRYRYKMGALMYVK